MAAIWICISHPPAGNEEPAPTLPLQPYLVLYLTSFCPPAALIIRILSSPLLNIVIISASKIFRIRLQPPPLAVLFALCLASPVLAYLLSFAYTAISSEISATINTSLLLCIGIVHPIILKRQRQNDEMI